MGGQAADDVEVTAASGKHKRGGAVGVRGADCGAEAPEPRVGVECELCPCRPLAWREAAAGELCTQKRN